MAQSVYLPLVARNANLILGDEELSASQLHLSKTTCSPLASKVICKDDRCQHATRDRLVI